MDAMKMDDITLSISSSPFPQEGEGPGIGAETGRIGPGSGNHWSDQYSGTDMSSPGSYTYNWGDGKYYDRYGNEVSFGEVFSNYVLPNSVGAPYSLYFPFGNSSQKGNHNHPQNLQPINTYDFIAAISHIILSNSFMSVSSEALCMIYYNSFKEYFDSFYGGDAERYYFGPENMPLFIEWLSEFSVLDPDIAYEQSCPEFTGDTKAHMWSVFIMDPSGHTQAYINPLISFINEITEIIYPYFAYHTWSTNKPYLNFDPINIVISGNEYRFIVIWYIPDKL